MPNQVQNVGFGSPGFDYGADISEIERRRALAAALQGESMQPLGQQQPGVAIHPFQGAAKIMQALAARVQGNRATQEQRDLSTRAQNDYQQALARGLAQMRGTPATAMSEDASGNVTPAQAAIPADPEAALGTFGSHPMLAPLQAQAIQKMQMEEWAKKLGGGAAQQQAPAPQSPQVPSVMAGSGQQPPAWMPPQAPAQAPQMASGASPQAAGPNLNDPSLWVGAPAGAAGYLAHMSKNQQTSGRVFYDQNGNAFTVNNAGQQVPLAGVKARDKGEIRNTGGVTDVINPFTGAVISSTANTLTPEQAADLPMKQGRYTWETGQRTPGAPAAAPGPVPAPSPVPMPGPQPQPGPAPTPGLTPQAQAALAAKRAADMPQARQAVELQVQDLDRLTNLAKEIKDHPGLGRATGLVGKAPSLPDVGIPYFGLGQAAGAEGLIDSLKAQVSGMKLQAMRNASKTGGAVGNVTEKEWPRLENMIVALDPVRLGTEGYKRKLDELVTEIGKVRKTMQEAFTSEYGQNMGAGGLSPAEQAELEALRRKYPRGR